MTNPLKPGDTIGILGGGQLGRMLALAAARLGLNCHIFEPGDNCPAGQVSANVTTASYDDLEALTKFAQNVKIVTYEFENIPESALDCIEKYAPVRPNRRALTTSQDRIVEKAFLAELGLKTAPYRAVSNLNDLKSALAEIGPNAILKTRRFGYDGKGQVRINARDHAENAWTEMKNAPSVLEGLIGFEREISVIAARGMDGQIACFDPGENLHEDRILRRTTVPAAISRNKATDAVILAGRILNALDYVGVMGIELFVTPQGLLVNEIAPRVHNSGHWTQNACVVDQFEQHIRAISGWQLADGRRHSNAVMENLIGDQVDAWRDTVSDGLHLYGKTETRPDRKMGHINRISPRETG